jgi:predicted NBD/HSP70 family sugar kinase
MKKNNNEISIIRHLFTHSGLTRTEIADGLQMRKNTVGILCEALLAKGTIREDPPNTRRNTRLFLEEKTFISLGVEHRLDSIRIVLMNTNRKVVFRCTEPLTDTSQDRRVKRIRDCLHTAIESASLPYENIVGIGFSDFIPHDIGTGLKTKSVWMPEWGDLNIRALLEEDLGFPVTIMRCTDAFSLAESAFGGCRNEKAFCVVQLDQGIGLSVFKGGRFLTGTTDIFGELGHTVYREDGEICKCGNRGCLETFAGAGAIVQKVEENIGRGLYFSSSKDSAQVTIDDIMRNAHEGNKLARLVLTEATKAIGDTIANMINMLGITRIQLYGELAKAGEILLQQVTSSIRKHCIYPLNQDAQVRISELDEYASAMGAASVVLERYVESM